jgi:TM2 domain-containing membrane protein YozV
VCLLTAWFFGFIGVHRFYVGKTASGIVMVLFTISYFGLIVSAIWSLVDLITILVGSFRDANNLVVKKWLD